MEFFSKKEQILTNPLLTLCFCTNNIIFIFFVLFTLYVVFVLITLFKVFVVFTVY